MCCLLFLFSCSSVVVEIEVNGSGLSYSTLRLMMICIHNNNAFKQGQLGLCASQSQPEYGNCKATAVYSQYINHSTVEMLIAQLKKSPWLGQRKSQRGLAIALFHFHSL